MPHKPVPKNRASLKGGDWFPHIFSKIAPLEWWNYCDSAAELRPDNFPDDTSYQLALDKASFSPV